MSGVELKLATKHMTYEKTLESIKTLSSSGIHLDYSNADNLDASVDAYIVIRFDGALFLPTKQRLINVDPLRIIEVEVRSRNVNRRYQELSSKADLDLETELRFLSTFSDLISHVVIGRMALLFLQFRKGLVITNGPIWPLTVRDSSLGAYGFGKRPLSETERTAFLKRIEGQYYEIQCLDSECEPFDTWALSEEFLKSWLRQPEFNLFNSPP